MIACRGHNPTDCVHKTASTEIPVPKLNRYQRSWLLDVAMHGVDIAGLDESAWKTYREKVKSDAFQEKVFQHVSELADDEEEARLVGLITDWKQKNHDKKNKKDAVDATVEADSATRAALLRGYPRAGWHIAIQKVLSNKRTATKSKMSNITKPAPVQKDAIAKLLDLTKYSRRDKFKEERRDDIAALAESLPDAINQGAKFRKAEALLWKEENAEEWETAAARIDEDVDWAESYKGRKPAKMAKNGQKQQKEAFSWFKLGTDLYYQGLQSGLLIFPPKKLSAIFDSITMLEMRQQTVAEGFKGMVQNLHASKQFRPFAAAMCMGWIDVNGQVNFEWVEAVPDDIPVPDEFKAKNQRSVQQLYIAQEQKNMEDSPVFTLSQDDFEDLSHKQLVTSISDFLCDSYEFAFGTRQIPWEDITARPQEYYDIDRLPMPLTSTVAFSPTEWHALGGALAAVAGPRTSNLFRKVPEGNDMPPVPPHHSYPPPLPAPPSFKDSDAPPPPKDGMPESLPPQNKDDAAPPSSKYNNAPPPPKDGTPEGLPPQNKDAAPPSSKDNNALPPPKDGTPVGLPPQNKDDAAPPSSKGNSAPPPPKDGTPEALPPQTPLPPNAPLPPDAPLSPNHDPDAPLPPDAPNHEAPAKSGTGKGARTSKTTKHSKPVDTSPRKTRAKRALEEGAEKAAKPAKRRRRT
ncbi:hypothetical protein B0H14DRAFT_3623719 [Mycena olivaceomarginata]|nr:hypothetical protein B0H14DRAFT_3623719 [Mycena olivaceomarginata]